MRAVAALAAAALLSVTLGTAAQATTGVGPAPRLTGLTAAELDTAKPQVEGWLTAARAQLERLNATFDAERDGMSHTEKARLAGRINSLEYQISDLQLAFQDAARQAGAPRQTAELPR